jgi:sigma-B regulation protein RsbU (phosphoserine phosphatase)
METEQILLQQKLEKLSNDLNVLLPLGIALSTEKDPDRLREKILLEARSICHADAGLLYLRTEDDLLRLAIRRSIPLHPELSEIEETTFFPPSPSLRLYDETTGAPNYDNVATTAALCGYSINIPNIYEAKEFDFSGTKAFDQQHNYRTISLLAIPLKDDDGRVIGVFELINAKDPATGQVVPFDSYHQMVAESLTSQTTIALKNQRLQERQAELLKFEQEIQIGRQIQADFLPEELPQPPGWEIVARFQPAREVAGDFYDAFTLSDGQIGLVIADVVDKGVGAALFMALFRSLIRFFGEEHRAEGASALDGVALTNQYISRNHSRSNMFATLFFGVLDPASGRLAYINGGHNPPFVLDAAGELKSRLRPTGPAVGMLPDMIFKTEQVMLEAGDLLLTFTDGVLDARNPAGQHFSEKHLLPLLQQPIASATALLDQLDAILQAHIANADQFDDITLLAVRRLPR